MIHTVHYPFFLGMIDKVHVVWAMYCVKSGFSNNSVDDFGDVLKCMCQTDRVSSKFQMGRAKLHYVILDEILKSPFMSILYDESERKHTEK